MMMKMWVEKLIAVVRLLAEKVMMNMRVLV